MRPILKKKTTSHVQFSEDISDEPFVIAELLEPNKYFISLGFLAFKNKYSAQFLIEHKYGKELKAVSPKGKFFDIQEIKLLTGSEVPSVCKDFVHKTVISIDVLEEPIIEETFEIKAEKTSFQIVIHCKVLTKQMGLPNLNKNIHLIERFANDDPPEISKAQLKKSYDSTS